MLVLIPSNEPNRCSVDFEDNIATLTVLDVSRSDAGSLQISAKNTQGIDEAEIRLDVVGPPSKPIGPLAIRLANFCMEASSMVKMSTCVTQKSNICCSIPVHVQGESNS